jgi:hypothetical protein
VNDDDKRDPRAQEEAERHTGQNVGHSVEWNATGTQAFADCDTCGPLYRSSRDPSGILQTLYVREPAFEATWSPLSEFTIERTSAPVLLTRAMRQRIAALDEAVRILNDTVSMTSGENVRQLADYIQFGVSDE